MGIRDDLRDHVDTLKTEWEEFSYLRHGCFCGAGDDVDPELDPENPNPWIDELDEACKTHDDDYGLVGYSFPWNFTPNGLIATIEADRKLAEAAASATVRADHPKSHPDPEGFRQRLIGLFQFKAWFGEQLKAALDAGESLGDAASDMVWDWVNQAADDAGEMAGDAVDSFKEWLLWAAPWLASSEPTPEDIRAGFAEHVQYLATVGVGRDQVDAAVRDAGVAPEQLEAEGLALTAVA
jgi:hypothetical protein